MLKKRCKMFTSIVVPGTKDGLNYLKVDSVAIMTILHDIRVPVVQYCLDSK